MFSSILAFAFVTSLASALHGGGYFNDKKWRVVTFHAVTACIINPVLLVSVALFWLLFRCGKQAKAELDFLSGKAGSLPIRKAYLPMLGYVMQKAMEWCQRNPLPEFRSEALRRQQELVGGFIISAMVGLPLLVIAKIMGWAW